MRARLLPLLDDGDRHLPQPLRQLGRVLQQLAEPDRAGEARGAGAHHEDTDLDPLLGRVARLGDELARLERGRELGRLHALRAWTSSVSFGTISGRSPTTPR